MTMMRKINKQRKIVIPNIFSSDTFLIVILSSEKLCWASWNPRAKKKQVCGLRTLNF